MALIEKKEYVIIMSALEEAMNQLKPDGNCCAVCGDNDHQAWECNHNPAVLFKRYWNSPVLFKCFHCGKDFNEETAEEHFGPRRVGRPSKCTKTTFVSDFPSPDGYHFCYNCDYGKIIPNEHNFCPCCGFKLLPQPE